MSTSNSINNDNDYYGPATIPVESETLVVTSEDITHGRVCYTLPTFRFTNVIQSILLLDTIIALTLWLTGGNSEYLLSNIVQFHLTLSVFDLALMTAVKAIVLIPLYTILEVMVNKQIDDPFISRHSTHASIAFITIGAIKFALMVFTIVKGGLILSSVLHKPAYPGMHPTYYALTATSAAFSLLEFAACFYGYRSLDRLVYQRIYHRVDSKGRKLDGNGKVISKSVNIIRLAKLAKKESGILSIAGIAMIGSCATQMVAPLFFGKIIDAATNSIEDLNRTVFILLGVYVFGAFVSLARSWCFALAGQRFVARLRKNLFAAVVQQEVAFFDTSRTGELCNRLASDTQVLQVAVTSNISQLFRYTLQIVGSLILMFWLNSSLTGVLLAVIPAVVVGTVQYGKFVKKIRSEFQDRLGDAGSQAEEALSTIRTVRAFSAEGRTIGDYSHHIDNSYQKGKVLAFAGGLFDSVVFFVANLSVMVILWYGGKLVLEHHKNPEKGLTPGLLTSFLMFTLNVAFAFSLLSGVYSNFMQAVGASVRIFELLDRVPEIPVNTGATPLDLVGAIEFRNVHFTYPARPDNPVLTGLSFCMSPGDVVALVGPSGGGKSTIVSMIERFYDPDRGTVYIGGRDLRILNPSYIRHHIALVSQEPTLFACSIRDNISYGRDASEAEVVEAAKQANAHDFISSFEMGYDTSVGERGVSLSGGQKQRIAIARALIMNPSILLLDEATSALDAESEHLVQEAIDRAMKGRTVIVIAHRLSTVRNASQVIVIERGQIAEQGTHKELLDHGGVYKRLVLRQLLATETSQDGGVQQLELTREDNKQLIQF